MKRCPLCSRVYADPSLNFCLDDGTGLVAAGDFGGATHPQRRASDVPTEALPGGGRGTNVAGEQTLPAFPLSPPPASRPAAPRSNRWLLAVVVVVLLSGGVGLGLILTRTGDGEEDTAKVVETPQLSTPTPYATATPTPSPTPSPTATPTATATPSPTATPKPTPDLQRARSEVMTVMSSWAESLRRQDVNANLRLYADQLDTYYQRGSVSREQVRADRQAIFSKFYSSTEVRLDNISVELDSSGTEARVTYDNSYNWRGGSRYLTGKSHNAMTLSKQGARWLITGEQHLKTYGERSGN